MSNRKGGKPPNKPPAKPPAKKPAPRQSSPRVSTISAKVLNGYKPTKAELLAIAASNLSQDQTKGQKPNRNKAGLA
jgi:hypothetical protein